MSDGSTNIWISITHENSWSCVRIDMNIFNIMYMDLFGIDGYKVVLFGNNVNKKNYNMTFMSKMIINLLSLVATRWNSFHPPSCIVLN
jgi:hypothetical protein